TVAAWDANAAARDALLQQNEDSSARVLMAVDLAELVRRVQRPRRLLVMVPAGEAVDRVIAALRPLLSPDDVIIDGGNTRFEDTRRREADLRTDGIRLVGMGISGGEEGARHGPSLMPGGTAAAWQLIKQPFEAIAARSEHGPCVTHVGPDGAGHFVKMVHNGIEYGDMQLLAEAYDVMRRGLELSASRIQEQFSAMRKGPLASFLVELSAAVMAKVDPRTGRPLVELVSDQAKQKGTGRWTVETALALGTPIPTIAAAVDARALCGDASLRQRMSTSIGGVSFDDVADAVGIVVALHVALLDGQSCTYSHST